LSYPYGVVSAALHHDLALTGILVDPDPPIPGTPAKLKVMVTNVGEATENISVSVEDAPDLAKVTVPNPVAGTATATVQDIVLGPGRSNDPDDIVFDWDTTGLALGPQTVRFRVNPVTEEADTANNSGSGTFVFEPDQDGDIVVDDTDNCLVDENPSQIDTDGDGFGNRCDPDFNQDGVVGAPDVNFFTTAMASNDPLADLDSDGDVDLDDRTILNSFFGRSPGPSGLCPGVPPNTAACP